MGTEPITDEEYEREHAILVQMRAPKGAFDELEARPRMIEPEPEPEPDEDEPGEDEASEDVSRETFLPPMLDRTADVQEVYDRTLAAIRDDETGEATAQAIAYVVATLHVADLPDTMGQFRAVLDQLQAVFGSGKAGGLLGKVLGGGKRG